ETAQHLRLARSTLPYGHTAQPGAAIGDLVERPATIHPEQGRQRHLQHVVFVPDHDANLHPESIPERGATGGIGIQIDDDVDALLLDPERGELREPRRLDAAHPTV